MIQFSKGRFLFEVYFILQKGPINDILNGHPAFIGKFMEIAPNEGIVEWLHEYILIGCI
jgi:hypothetical protein